MGVYVDTDMNRYMNTIHIAPITVPILSTLYSHMLHYTVLILNIFKWLFSNTSLTPVVSKTILSMFVTLIDDVGWLTNRMKKVIWWKNSKTM